MMHAIKVNSLSKYYGRSRGVINLNFSVSQGETYGFIGPNGAGKSTTIRILLNLLFPTSGSAEVLGMDSIKDGKMIRRKVGFVPSEVNFYNYMRVIDLLKYSARFYKVSLNGYFKRLVDTLEIDINRKIEDLSMGNRKKVAVAQALIHRPELLILDEPTSGLDPLIQSRFFEIIREENKRGTTVFLSSHILSEVEKLCHRVAIIKEGRIIREDNISHLKSTQMSRVRLHLSVRGSSVKLDTTGIIDRRDSSDEISFLFKGDNQQLLKELSKLPIIRVNIEEPDLEEVFLHYYKK